VIALGVASSLQAEEIIKDKSPDGKFALRIEGWDTEIIESATKKKVIDLENLPGHDATLIWSGDSQRVAYFNESLELHTTTVYYRKGSTFAEIPLPEFPRCDEVKDKDPKELRTVFYTVMPKYWQDSGALFLSISGEWETSSGQFVNCEQDLAIAFDAQHQASVQKTEKKQNPVGQKIESPNGTFFVEELDAPAKDDEGRPRMDQEVWIVSAKDPAMRERLPGFYMEEGSGVVSGAAISPDESWMLVAQHRGSHMNLSRLFHRKEGMKFEDVFPNAKWPPDSESEDRFDNEAWKFFSKVEGIPLAKIDMKDLGPEQISFLDWSPDSGRLLIDLHGGLTGGVETPDRNLYKKPGVSVWLAYFNTKTKKFELTDRLRACNKGARKRWKAMDNANEEAPEDGFVPPSAESIGHERPDAPVAERLKEYEAQLAAMVKRRAGQLDGDDRVEFEKKEREWRDKLEEDAAQIKDPAKQLGRRARSIWYHIEDVREERLPIYEEPKSAAEK
jgi:hypothetical protein